MLDSGQVQDSGHKVPNSWKSCSWHLAVTGRFEAGISEWGLWTKGSAELAIPFYLGPGFPSL